MIHGRAMDFADKNAVVVGGSRGIGFSVASMLASMGARVALIARDAASLNNAVLRLNEVSVQGHAGFACDASNPTELRHGLRSVLSSFEHIDIMFFNVGEDSRVPFEATNDKEWHRLIDSNLTGAFVAMQEVLPSMQARHSGAVVVNASVKGLVAHGEDPIYCATKAGLIMLAKALALRVADSGVRINVVCPGPVTSHAIVNPAVTIGRVPLRRAANPQEVASLVVFLLSDNAAYITGAAVPLDGGKSAGFPYSDVREK